jgi:hypothetical protein
MRASEQPPTLVTKQANTASSKKNIAFLLCNKKGYKAADCPNKEKENK